MFESILIGLLVEIITKWSEKLKVSQTYVSIGLAIVLGAIYYIASTYYNVERQKLVEFIGGIYASSQLFFNIFKKWGIFNQKK